MAKRPRLQDDPYLRPYWGAIERRTLAMRRRERELIQSAGSLASLATGYERFGLVWRDDHWVHTEWAPAATAVYLIGDFSGWREERAYALHPVDGYWQIELPPDALQVGDLYRLKIYWPGGAGDRIPAYAKRVLQDPRTGIFNAQVVAADTRYTWQHGNFSRSLSAPLVYEAHVGMAIEREGVGTYDEFRRSVLPRIVDSGYNTVQLMAIMEHPYYGSFGYHVSSFFAASSRFGPVEDLKRLIDDAHGAGLAVIMDLIHSHAVRNEVEGLSHFDGTDYQYFHAGDRGWHFAWDSRCFDYGKREVLEFLLSNCRFWLEEYHVDGFRFDGITSMLYLHHGLGPGFNSYDDYFNHTVDEDAYVYLALANKLIHEIRPDALTIAEDVSGMPGLAAPIEQGGAGFDYRLAMGVPDHWFKLVNDTRDEDWSMPGLMYELTNKRPEERTLSYVECHDQALVGGKTLVFELMDAAMYDSMAEERQNLIVDRGMALHKMARLLTIATTDHGYLNFMGNEFGHPEWVDFPREGNNWSYYYARRQWSLVDHGDLKYRFLGDFDKAMIEHVKRYFLLEESLIRRLREDDERKLLFFERAGSFFFFNFHWDRSYTDFPVIVPPGEYALLLDTDELRFGGHNRLTPNQRYLTEPVVQNQTINDVIRIYLPCRTAIVLRRTGR